jgi:argininosuccinate lyase
VCGVVSNTQFNVEKIAVSLDEGFLDATSLAEYLVRKGVAFREAHGIVGTLVADCEKQGKKLADVALAEFKKYSSAIGKDVYKYLGAANVVSKYVSEGSAGRAQAKKQIAFWKKQLAGR